MRSMTAIVAVTDSIDSMVGSRRRVCYIGTRCADVVFGDSSVCRSLVHHVNSAQPKTTLCTPLSLSSCW